MKVRYTGIATGNCIAFDNCSLKLHRDVYLQLFKEFYQWPDLMLRRNKHLELDRKTSRDAIKVETNHI